MTVEEASRQIRREAGRLSTTAKVLEQIQRDLTSAALETLSEVAAGGRPLTAEAHLVAALQEALDGLEPLHEDLSYASRKQTLRQVEEDRRAGTLPVQLKRALISAALEALRG